MVERSPSGRATHERSQSSLSPPTVGIPNADAALRRVLHELALSAMVFRDYGHQHLDKANAIEIGGYERDSRLAKSKRNLDRSAACEAALEAYALAIEARRAATVQQGAVEDESAGPSGQRTEGVGSNVTRD